MTRALGAAALDAGGRWVELSMGLSAYAVVWHAYAQALPVLAPDGAAAGGWLIAGATAVSYSGLALLLLLPPLGVARAIARALRPRSDPPAEPPQQETGPMPESMCLFSLLVVAALTAVADFAAVVDITQAPLVADTMMGLWRSCAAAALLLTVAALPIYLTAPTPAPADAPRWHLLVLPAVAASAAAGELAQAVAPHNAAGLLGHAYVLWGASVVPALCFAVVQARSACAIAPSIPAGRLAPVLAAPLTTVALLAAAIMALGIHGRRVWNDPATPASTPLLLGELAMAGGAILGLLLWAAAAAWFATAHVLAIMAPRPPGARMAGRQLCAAAWSTAAQLAYPLAAFALATIYLARIWSSVSALLCARVLLAYLTLLLLVVPAAGTALAAACAVYKLLAPTPKPLLSHQDHPPASYGSI
ncbi:hypothetical protein H4R19_000298 [Coemansia spiralis]|nr:hypothetical protein H4R19_000298 [Coemansia spiralis]